MNLQSIMNKSKQYVKLLNWSKMSISRWEDTVLPDKTKKQTLVLKYSNIECKISSTQLITDNPNSDKSVVQGILWRPKVFCDDGVDIKAGDYVVVTSGTKEYKGNVSDIMLYDGHHIEFSIGIDKEA